MNLIFSLYLSTLWCCSWDTYSYKDIPEKGYLNWTEGRMYKPHKLLFRQKNLLDAGSHWIQRHWLWGYKLPIHSQKMTWLLTLYPEIMNPSLEGYQESAIWQNEKNNWNRSWGTFFFFCNEMIHSSPVYSREKKSRSWRLPAEDKVSNNVSIWLGCCSEMVFLGFRV